MGVAHHDVRAAVTIDVAQGQRVRIHAHRIGHRRCEERRRCRQGHRGRDHQIKRY